MSSNNIFYRNPYLVLLSLTACILFICLLLNPARIPPPVRTLDVWVRTHWWSFVWAIVGLGIADFVISVERFQSQADKRIEMLERKLAAFGDRLNETHKQT